MWTSSRLLVASGAIALGSACAGRGAAAPPPVSPAPSAAPTLGSSPAGSRRLIGQMLDDWHAAAAAADEERYFAHFAPDAVFMGTDSSERWSVTAFREYAHPHFERGKAWSFRASRRAIEVQGSLGWFDEDLIAPNLGPARGSGVVRHDGKAWLLVHYNLTITVPNEHFSAVKELLESRAAAGSED